MVTRDTNSDLRETALTSKSSVEDRVNKERARAEKVDAHQFLRTLDEFRNLPVQATDTLADYSRFAEIDSGQYISTEGEDEGLYGFIVVRGCLAMTKSSVSGKDLIVELLQSGDIFGLLLMLAAEKTPSQLSARALQKSTVLWVPISNFMHMLKNHEVLFKGFASHLLLCLQSSYRLSRGMAHDRVEVRIAAVLVSLATKFPKGSGAETVPTIYFTRQQLADLTGTTSETAIRVTRSMQREGLIEINRPGVIRILRLRGLQELTEL